MPALVQRAVFALLVWWADAIIAINMPAHSQRIIPVEVFQMHQDDCNKPSTETTSQPDTSQADAWWVEAMKPSRQRNMTQSERQQLARALRQLRAERYAETRGE